MRPLWLLFAAMLVVACNETVDVGSNAGEPDVGEDADPGQDTPDTGADDTRAPDAPDCTDESCGEGMICEDGACVAGCRTSEDCASPNRTQVCFENRCVGCRDDQDCTLETVCTSDECVDGCRDDDGCGTGRICGDDAVCTDGCRTDEACPDGSICTDTACVAGCRADEGCPLGMVCADDACVDGCREDARCQRGSICTEDVCVPGCRTDDGCDRGSICVADACVDGCRDDQGCETDRLCLETVCVFRGVGCRADDDCAERDVCDLEVNRCEAGEEPCLPDDLEPNDAEDNPTRLDEGSTRASICPGDVDWFVFELGEEDALALDLEFNAVAGTLDAVLRLDGADLTRSGPTPEGARLTYTARAAGVYTVRVAAADELTRLSYGVSLRITPPMMCVETELYEDIDDDGYGDGDPRLACLEEDEQTPGYVREAGDCGPTDPLRYPGAEGICGDRVDDDCQGGDEACPESRNAPPRVPAWDCTGDPPSSVYAFARFDNGGGYFRDGGCFFFFEGLPGEFYVKRVLERTNESPSCLLTSGCTCPSLNGWPAYDRRMYAFTLDGAVDDCPDIWLRDHGTIDADLMVSNACRKYLLQLHLPTPPGPAEIGFITGNIENLRQRLRLYPRVEVACVQDRPHANLPYQSLLVTDIVFNENFEGQ